MPRRPASIPLVLILAFGLAGCASAPSPVEPSPRFTSDADAFAAAEETYRAYVDALNRVDLRDPETFEAVYAWTTGDLNASDRKGLSRYHADGVTVSGQSVPLVVAPGFSGASSDVITIDICLDVSVVGLPAQDGSSLVAADRVEVQSLSAEFEKSPSTATGFAIAQIAARTGTPACAG